MNIPTISLGSRLVGYPAFVDASQEIALDEGRPARMAVSEEPGIGDGPPMPFAATAVELDGYLVLVFVLYQGEYLADLRGDEPPPAADIESAPTTVTFAVAAALEASLADGR